MSQYRYVLIDEFGGACRKFVSKVEATPYMTEGMRLVTLPREPKLNLYFVAASTLLGAPF